jgi:acetyl-CoA carboxylase biotin carboxyl carrier protein
MSLSADEIKEILDAVEAAGWDEARITVGDVTLSMSKGSGSRPAAVAASPAVIAPSSDPVVEEPPPAPSGSVPTGSITSAPSGHVVVAPSVGVFWRSPEPGAPPFVEVGASVEAGQNLCIVEVMKLMNHVTTAVAGVVVAVHVANGEPVESGTPLFSIDVG